MKPKKKRHPLLFILDIVIAVLTVILAISITGVIISSRESDAYRYSPNNYTYTVQSGDYRALAQDFVLAAYRPIPEEKITTEIRPYAAIADYYVSSFYLGIYRAMGDGERTQATEERLAQDREDMAFYLPEADKIDKIFDRE
ncbi:MAG: hypothetical protein K6G16_05040 [Lachnospiraceae bacterium]|nr:hypothetical protein [Lachnospiraceae bacterium]